ncbi:endonuclease I [Vibrio sp. 10N.286.55.E10]|uniref:endonuclease n=1 Tax=unclassified Vibrio TaxID=2614977 RepID=UPI000C827905|nr:MULTISPECIES: endonuclease [unclassified Vibrio]PME27430.1 endonuclease I [Vibrio sp. 10N.286.55.E12]PME36818.1 endonuclease I [Vibrio sp. 10N.286.55.E10]PME69534.1 endonuclease I [Vibrio sp. 10N.286.55.C11]
MINRIITLSGVALLCSASAHAQMQNGSFENWEGNVPSGWSVIDSGIAVSPSSVPVNNGSFSAQVTVNTSTQSNTDFLQTIRVEQGKTYDFSVDVYHTEGNVKARLFVDGYLGYSNNGLTNQWQALTHSYSATSTKDIVVGIRFYDDAGFDGSEVVYLDNFQPTETPPTQSCNDTSAALTLVTDNYGSETSWSLKNSVSQTLYSGSDYKNNTINEVEMCLADGSYILEVSDSYGDGMCCSGGNGSYSLSVNGTVVASGGDFQASQSTEFTIGGSTTPPTEPPVLGEYYKDAEGKVGFALKTALYQIIDNHSSQGYTAIWTLVSEADLDAYYDTDGSILDMYSEKPSGSDSIQFTKVADQCGQYRKEGDCYNREHSFPKSWFGGKVEPMNSDGHHLFATDGYVNSKRSNWPFGEVSSATYTSSNGSKLGSAANSLGYVGTVFEPIDEFKGDFARAYFYMATRYENEIANWEGNSTSSDAVLDGTNTTVFEPWLLTMLKRWHSEDPVSQKEIDRNKAVYDFQGNRNPFIDHPEFVSQIWGN